MCRTYNIIGSLTTLKTNLEENNIYDFKSLKEVIDFKSSYSIFQQQIISNHVKLIEQEKNHLIKDLQQLDITIETKKKEAIQSLIIEIEKLKQQLIFLTKDSSSNIFQKLTKTLDNGIGGTQKRHIWLKLKSINNLLDIRKIKNNRFQFITSQFDMAVEESSQKALSDIERKKSVIDNLNNVILGALGENKVVKTLEYLSDDYILINDFAISSHYHFIDRMTTKINDHLL
ncbi:MAG: hypothetical protein IPF62_00035 [Bacteroidetes bacterium]|nr:hypothetical protein [Bacteroidota bacterium]